MAAGFFDNKGAIARWGKKEWRVTQSQIKTLSEATLNVEYDKSKKKKKVHYLNMKI